ncbi:MAG: murein L,D-transpeptidase catalytic domain family protein [Chitinophagaceae bacterium]|jgi:hypothetical protein|nr:murein L,D-transpeptidase catalytic domain family protein [Chitinophagaceae bacterium]
MKIYLVLLISICPFVNTHASSYNFVSNKSFYSFDNNNSSIKLKTKLKDAKVYCTKQHYNTDVCFLLDYSLPSGENRFFVCDMKNNTVLLSGLVAHGSCNTRFLKDAKFSNQIGCGCSSSGKYKTGQKYKGRFGTAYKLYGLEASNSNAFARNVVLHSYSGVPEKEVAPLPICNSLGCAMVSTGFMKKLDKIISAYKRPILLWIYE